MKKFLIGIWIVVAGLIVSIAATETLLTARSVESEAQAAVQAVDTEPMQVEKVLIQTPTLAVFIAKDQAGEQYIVILMRGEQARKLAELSGGTEFYLPEHKLVIIFDTSREV